MVPLKVLSTYKCGYGRTVMDVHIFWTNFLILVFRILVMDVHSVETMMKIFDSSDLEGNLPIFGYISD